MLKSELRTENTHVQVATGGAAWYVVKSHSNATTLKYTTPMRLVSEMNSMEMVFLFVIHHGAVSITTETEK